MISRILSVWSWFGSSRPGFFSGTILLLIMMLSIHVGGIQASLSLGPEGNLPRFRGKTFWVLFFLGVWAFQKGTLQNIPCYMLLVYKGNLTMAKRKYTNKPAMAKKFLMLSLKHYFCSGYQYKACERGPRVFYV